MARLTTTGIELAEERLQQIEKSLRAEAIPKMLNAGADVLIRKWQDQIQGKGHVRTGEMLGHVEKTEVRIEPNGASIEVYPTGTDSHRVTNAQKAFILHYGRKPNKRGRKEIKGDKFVTQAEKAAKAEVDAAMQQALNEITAGKE